MLAWPLPSVRGEDRNVGLSILFISVVWRKRCQKNYHRDNWLVGRPSFIARRRFWSFDVGSSYHCEADFSPSKGNRASAVSSYNQVRSTWLTTEPSIASNATVVYYTQYTVYCIQWNHKQISSKCCPHPPKGTLWPSPEADSLRFACDSHYCIV